MRLTTTFYRLPITRFLWALLCIAPWYGMHEAWKSNATRKQVAIQSVWPDIITVLRFILGVCEPIFWSFYMSAINQSRWIMSFNRWNPDASRVRWLGVDFWKVAVVGSIAAIVGVALLIVGLVSSSDGDGDFAGWLGSSILVEILIRACTSLGWICLIRSNWGASSGMFRWLKEHF